MVVLEITRREESGCFRDNKVERRVGVLEISRREESGGFRDNKERGEFWF